MLQLHQIRGALARKTSNAGLPSIETKPWSKCRRRMIYTRHKVKRGSDADTPLPLAREEWSFPCRHNLARRSAQKSRLLEAAVARLASTEGGSSIAAKEAIAAI
jgi:hypothetical protein